MSSPAERAPAGQEPAEVESPVERAASPATTATRSASATDPSDRYLDFEVEIAAGVGRAYPLAVTSSPAGEAREVMHFPFDELALESRLKSLRLALVRSGGPRRDVATAEEDDVRSFGRSLFEALLTGRTRVLYDASLQRARELGKGLRLKLRIQPPELACLPWEYVYDPGRAEYLSLSRDTPIVRFVELGRPIEPLLVEPPLRILGMMAGPVDLAPLDTQRERERVDRALAHLQAAGIMELTWLEGHTWRDLQAAMRRGPWHVFHFVGHGDFDPIAGQGIVALSDENGRAHRLSATELGRLLADHHSLRLVILNSCEGARGSARDLFSSTAAILVRRGLPAVLAMQDEITDRAAVEFSRSFYEALADAYPVDAAVAEARKAVSLAVTNSLEWGTPVLYMRAPRGVIFEMPAHAAVKRLPPRPTAADDERRARVEALYTDALGAFWIEEWGRACDRLAEVLELDPGHEDARARLAEARQRQELALLREQARTAADEGDWPAAVAALERVLERSPDDAQVEQQLAEARTYVRRDELVGEAVRLHDAGRWSAVVNVVAQIHDLDPGFDDVDELAVDAERELAEGARRERLDELYRRALEELEAERWASAQSLLRQIAQDETGYRDTVGLLRRCERELAAAEAERARRERADALYAAAVGHAARGRWRRAVRAMDELERVDPGHADPERVGERAREELEPPATAGTGEAPADAQDGRPATARRRGRFLVAGGVMALLVAGGVLAFVLVDGGSGPWVDDRFDGSALDESVWRELGDGDVRVADGLATVEAGRSTGAGSLREAGIIGAQTYPLDGAMYAEARVLFEDDSSLESQMFLMLGNDLVGNGLILERRPDGQEIARFGVWHGDQPLTDLRSARPIASGRWRDLRIEYTPADAPGADARFAYRLDGELLASWEVDVGSEQLRVELATTNRSSASLATGRIDEVRTAPLD